MVSSFMTCTGSLSHVCGAWRKAQLPRQPEDLRIDCWSVGWQLGQPWAPMLCITYAIMIGLTFCKMILLSQLSFIVNPNFYHYKYTLHKLPAFTDFFSIHACIIHELTLLPLVADLTVGDKILLFSLLVLNSQWKQLVNPLRDHSTDYTLRSRNWSIFLCDSS